MTYRVYLPNDGEPHEQAIRLLLDCLPPTFVRVDGDLVVWDYTTDDAHAEMWLNAHESVIAWEVAP